MKSSKINIKESFPFDLQRKVVSYATTTSWRSIPHVSYLYEPDITDFYKKFIYLSAERRKFGHVISFNTIMIKVIANGLMASPKLNSFVEFNYSNAKGKINVCDKVNAAIPWLLPDGRMITPIIPSVDKMSLNDISDYILNLEKRIEKTNIDEVLYKTACQHSLDEIKKLNFSIVRKILSSKVGKNSVKALKGKEKKKYYSIPEKERLTSEDILNGTVTISNIGPLIKEQKGCFSIIEIVPPQAFAIGISSIQEKPGIYLDERGNKQIGIRKTLPMCLVFDHRALDFSSLTPFIKKVDEIFAHPEIIYRW